MNVSVVKQPEQPEQILIHIGVVACQKNDEVSGISPWRERRVVTFHARDNFQPGRLSTCPPESVVASGRSKKSGAVAYRHGHSPVLNGRIVRTVIDGRWSLCHLVAGKRRECAKHAHQRFRRSRLQVGRDYMEISPPSKLSGIRHTICRGIYFRRRLRRPDRVCDAGLEVTVQAGAEAAE
jgi:hypothetical protein